MTPKQPTVVVLGGINGAGKTTSSQALLADQLAVMCFVNADTIARGLNAIRPESVALSAGKIMLTRLRELVVDRADFAFETTLSGKTYLPFLRSLRENGYIVELYYFWLRSADLAVSRVRARVRRGGHDIPEATVRQRYQRSLTNFWTGYRREADAWYLYDNSDESTVLVAAGHRGAEPTIGDMTSWATFLEVLGHA